MERVGDLSDKNRGAGAGRAAESLPPVHPTAIRTLGRTGLRAAKIGFGAYRVRADMEEHRRSLAAALLGGCNLIDTSTNYSDGLSEALVGEVLEAADRRRFIAVSKAGYVQGSNYARAQEADAKGAPYPEMVRYGEGLWHCVHPLWLEEELERSLERLRLERLDVFLLHNPEYFLNHAKRVALAEARAVFYERVGRAFEAMERFADEGRVSWYGVSSNTFAAPMDDPAHVSLERLLALAESVAGRGHRFAFAQLPFNLLESGPMTEPVSQNGASFLELAQDSGIAVLTNRPLNAIRGENLFRLAEYPSEEGLAAPLETFAAAAAAERDIHLALRSWRLMKNPEKRFCIGETAKRLYPKAETATDWIHLFERYLAPGAMAAAHEADQRIDDARQDEWAELKSRYSEAVHAMARSALSRLNRRDSKARAPLREALSQALGQEAEGMSLSETALNAAASVKGVSVVLNGMKRISYVSEALRLLRTPDFTDPQAAFRSRALSEIMQ